MIIIVAVVALFLSTMGITYYLKRSVRSYHTASGAWKAVVSRADHVIAGDFPLPAKQIALGLAHAAGCGCFVRGMFIAAYLPIVARWRETRATGSASSLFTDTMDEMTHAQKTHMHLLFMSVIVYDSFANPLQGWFFRRALRRYATIPQRERDLPPKTEVVRTEATAVSVLARARPVPIRELCAA